MIVGITGSIGSGKSTVTKYLSDKGYNTFSCDEYNKELLNKDSIAYNKLKKAFPTCFKDKDLDKKALSSLIFNNKEEKDKLENILHPLIIKEMKRQIKNNKDIFIEVPLLFEANLDKYFEHILLVVCDEKIALERLEKRGLSKKESKERLKNQMPVKNKIIRANYLIYNNGSLNDLYKEIKKWLKEYVRI